KFARLACGTKRRVFAAAPCAKAGAGNLPVNATVPAPATAFSSVLRSMSCSPLASCPGLTRASIFFVQSVAEVFCFSDRPCRLKLRMTQRDEGTTYWVYILASRPGGTLYVGITNDLIRRIFEHREGLVPGFTKRYGVKKLVYYEHHETALA